VGDERLLSEETIKSLLKEIGLTDKETEVYIFLAKRGALKGVEITKRLKKHKAQIYNILKNLQTKGLVESTLEFPARFTAIPLETAIDLNIKAKRDAAALIENTKRDILEYWKKVSQPEQPLDLERFVVVEGYDKIYPKMAQMIKDSKGKVEAIIPFRCLLQADQFGVFDTAPKNTEKRNMTMQYRVLMDFSSQNVPSLKELLRTFPTKLGFHCRTLDLGVRLFPQLVIKDDEEILLFISNKEKHLPPENEMCLWTNCRALVKSFSGVFEDLWSKSKDLKQKILEVETGKLATQRHFVLNKDAVEKTFKNVLTDAKEEIIVLTSSSGLELWKQNDFLEQLAAKGVSFNVMMPLTSEKLGLLSRLPKDSEVRHVADGDLTTILVDGHHIFQFGGSKLGDKSCFESYFYTDDINYVETTTIALNDIWEIAPRATVTESKSKENAMETETLSVLPYSIRHHSNKVGGYRLEEYEEGSITEKEIISKMIQAKRTHAKDPYRDIAILYGSYASAVVQPPASFNLPPLTISVWHCNKQSSFGEEDYVTISMQLETPNGNVSVPVTHVTDNPGAAEFRKGVYAKTPAGQNSILARKDQLQVRVQGNTLFAGWTVPLPLYPPGRSLPPCCILYEGCGALKSGISKTIFPSGRTQVYEWNRFEAAVTFSHSDSKYSASGTKGIFDRERIMTAYPPKQR
jgi:sugar-specific transcriptional regulator TrmB